MGLFSKDQTHYRINDSASQSILIWAGIFDLFSLVPILNIFVGFIGWPVLLSLLGHHKVNDLSSRLYFSFFVAVLAEAFPIMSTFPTYWFFSRRAIAHSRKEDDAKEPGADGRLF